MDLNLDIYGVKVEISVHEQAAVNVLKRLEEDFSYFKTPHSARDSQIRLQISGYPFQRASEKIGALAFKTKLCKAYGWAGTRYCDYGSGTWVKSSRGEFSRVITVFGDQEDSVYEASYVALLSSIGEELDLKGYHRLHALGVQRDGKSIAITGSPGLGKSLTAMTLLRDSNVKIFSDEITLIRDGRLYPFPIRVALLPQVAEAHQISLEGVRLFRRKTYPAKALFPIPKERVAEIAPLQALWVGCREKKTETRAEALRMRAAFVLSFTLGLGLAQMSEHMLSLDLLPRLIKIACLRFKTALRLSRGKTDAFRSFQFLNDARANADRVLQSITHGD